MKQLYVVDNATKMPEKHEINSVDHSAIKSRGKMAG
jgi:hypothetical protein